MVISLECQAKECELYKVGDIQVSCSMYFLKDVYFYNPEVGIKIFF